jgi:ribosome assembly protein RRB1
VVEVQIKLTLCNYSCLQFITVHKLTVTIIKPKKKKMDQKLRNKLKKDKKKRSALAKKQPATTTLSSSHSNPPPTTTTTNPNNKKIRKITFEDSTTDPLTNTNLQYEFEDGEEELEQEEYDDEEQEQIQDDDDDDNKDETMINGDNDDDLQPTQTVYFRNTTNNNNNTTPNTVEMEHDESAYGMLHRMCFEWPAMSFDFVRDGLGAERSKYPHTVWLVQGSCSGIEEASPTINVMRADTLVRTKKTVEDEEEELMGAIPLNDDGTGEEEIDVDPNLESRSFPIDGGVNRIRCSPHAPGIVATWSDTGKVHLYDVSRALSSLHHLGSMPMINGQGGLFYSFIGHGQEGFAMDWARCKTGRLVTGDCNGKIFVWDMDTSRVVVDPIPYTGHNGSVEDIQYSPTEESVFASCSTDGTIKIWDTRATSKHGGMLSEKVHEMDVNVISWNTQVSFLLASGSDDCSFKIWDLRAFKSTTPVGWFKSFHTAPISAIEWSPHDESVLCVSSEDDQISLWDLSLEEDPEVMMAATTTNSSSNNNTTATSTNKPVILDQFNNPVDIPPQLLFVHSGLINPKETHFHPHIVGLVGATGAEGFDLFISEPLERNNNTQVMDGISSSAAAASGGDVSMAIEGDGNNNNSGQLM